MDRCPRCGVTLSPFAPACLRCGLRRHQQGLASPGEQVPIYGASPPSPPLPPRRRRATLLMAGVSVVAVLSLAVGGGLWLTDTGPFAPLARDSPSAPVQSVVTVTSSAPAPSTTTEPASQPTAATTSRAPTPPPPQDFSEVYADVESGVGLITAQTCDSRYTGTGFLVDESTLVTAAHVIEGATKVAVDFDGERVGASILGVEPTLDLAVLRLSRPVSGRHVFTLASADPQPGTHIAVIGYPLGEPKSLTEGTISGLDRTISTESGTYFGLLQTDAAINPGNSGGPLLDSRGRVVGLADAIRRDAQGIGFAVAVSQIGPAIESTATLSQPLTPGCLDPQSPSGPSGPFGPTGPVERGVRHTLGSYLGAINRGDFDGAMIWLGAELRADSSAEQWHRDYATTYDDQLEIQSISGSWSRPEVWATFRSRQNPGYGPETARDATCLVWSIDYELQQQGGRWVIVEASGHDDPPWTRCD